MLNLSLLLYKVHILPPKIVGPPNKHNLLNTATVSAVGIAARVRVVFEKQFKNPG